MNAKVVLASALLLCCLGAAVVAAAPSVTAVVCTEVKDRAPVGAASTFPATVGKLYCFSEIKGGADKVIHVWIHGDKELAKMELPVRGERWRTWSVKSIAPKLTGAWKVEVRGADGTVLATASFEIQ